MQKLVRLVLQHALVQVLDERVLIALPDRFIIIDSIESCRAGIPRRAPEDDRLSAAHDAAASAGHDLNQIILHLPGFESVEHDPGISKP